MRKFALLIPVLLLCLTGCGAKTGTINCTLSSNNVVNGYKIESEYKINYKGDTVESVETLEVVTSSSNQLLDYFETSLNESYSKMNDNYGGYDYSVTKEEGKVSSKVKIDYNKMNIEQFVKDQPALKSYVSGNKLLTDGVKSLYESMGATCK